MVLFFATTTVAAGSLDCATMSVSYIGPFYTSRTQQRSLTNKGIWGPRPPQAYYSDMQSNYAPTDIESALHTMSLNPPRDEWYMDTGATSHMTSDQGYNSNAMC